MYGLCCNRKEIIRLFYALVGYWNKNGWDPTLKCSHSLASNFWTEQVLSFFSSKKGNVLLLEKASTFSFYVARVDGK